MRDLYTSDEVRQLIWNLVAEHGTQRALAKHLGTSAQLINDILRGNREPTGPILTELGLKKTIRYEKVN